MQHHKPIRVLYFNGPSSVGKTTIIRVLQNLLLPTPYLRIGVDQIIDDMMPSAMNDWRVNIVHEEPNSIQGFYCNVMHDTDGATMHIIKAGPFAIKLLDLFRDLALTTLSKGYNVIIDDVAEHGAVDVDLWRDALKDYSVLWIGLTAALDVLEERERTRGNRAPGTSRAQLKTVHEGVTYDLFFDTSKESATDIAHAIRAVILQTDAKNPVGSL
jgi:chloramphenicol 3-O phosphotransferase